jgi:hypothetical protein
MGIGKVVSIVSTMVGGSVASPRDASDDSRPLREWSAQEKRQQSISFVLSSSWYYQFYWPLERQVQASASKLLFGGGQEQFDGCSYT